MAWCGDPSTLHDWLVRWNTEPVQLVLLAVLLAAGVMLITEQRRWMFVSGWLALVVAFVSPLCALTAALFSARVIHHFVLVLIAAPLFAMAFPARVPRGAAAAGVAFTAAMWAWHWPAAYVFAYDTVAGYWAMQASLLFVAVWLWRCLLAPRTDLLTGLVVLVAVSAAMGMLGALLTLAPAALYPPHYATAGSFGLTALQDQQLGGLLMWVPGILPFAAAGIVLARSRFQHMAREAAR